MEIIRGWGQQLDERIIRETQNPLNQNVEDLLHKLLPSEIVDWFADISDIDKSLEIKNLKKETRALILNSLKNFKLTYLGLDDIERATVTAGGVNVKEINPKTLESKITPGIYFAGEIQRKHLAGPSSLFCL